MANYQSNYTGAQIDALLAKAGTAVQGVKVNGSELAKDGNGKVDVTLNKAAVGLGNVDNTADANKPVSTAQSAAITAAVAAEATARNTAITNAVSAEATARNTAIGTAVSAEATARDTAIAAAAAAEVTARDTAIASSIATEVANRNGAIGTAILAEASDRNAAIAAAIATEVSNRNDAISVAGAGKMDKVQGAVQNNFPKFGANGAIIDSGKKAADFATAAQGTKADAAVLVTSQTLSDAQKGQARSNINAANDADLVRIARDFGRYANPVEVTLSRAISGKYVDKDSALEVANAAYGISAPVSIAAGDIILIPSASAVLAACSVVSRKVTRTYDKVIIYTYTYDALSRIATAKADYDASLIYTAHYASDEASTPDYWTIGASQVQSLPETHSVTESFYVPLVKQSVAGMPDTGYYVYLSDVAQDVVISALTATVNGGRIIKAGWGIFKNIASNFIGNDRQRVVAEALCTLAAAVAGIEDKLQNGISRLVVGDLVVGRKLSGLNVDGSFCLQGAGVPAAATVPVNYDAETYGDWKGIPQFIGQEYLNTTNNVFYKAKGVSAVADWIRISNA